MRAALAILVMAASAGACSAIVASRIVDPPRYGMPSAEREVELRRAGSSTEYLKQTNGPRIAYAVIEPGDHRLHYEFRSAFGRWAWREDFHDAIPRMPPRGTVVLLHGWSQDLASNLLWGLAFAERGWRAVLVDLRNHGRSGRAPAGFGAREAADVDALLAALDGNGRLVRPLALFGVSMGAVVALHVAAGREDVAALIALEPYANAADGVRTGLTGVVNDATRALVEGETLERAILRAGRKLELDLTTLDTAPVLARVRACSIVVHGQRDRVIPVDATRALAGSNPRVQRLELPSDGHFSTVGRLDLLADPFAAWLAAVGPGRSDCPRLAVYAGAPTDGTRSVLRSPWRAYSDPEP